jgi:hypothetical protein
MTGQSICHPWCFFEMALGSLVQSRFESSQIYETVDADWYATNKVPAA